LAVVIANMKTMLVMLSLLALTATAFAVPSASATCVVGTCVEGGSPYCVERVYQTGGDYVYLVCQYGSTGDATCAAALYERVTGNNHGIACVDANQGGCVAVAIVTNDDAGTGWQQLIC
jgi:hypothetical protein